VYLYRRRIHDVSLDPMALVLKGRSTFRDITVMLSSKDSDTTKASDERLKFIMRRTLLRVDRSTILH
jgi:hypothetical protein